MNCLPNSLIAAIIILGTSYVLVSLIGPIQLIILFFVLVSSAVLLKRRWTLIRQQGIINRLSPKLRKLLLQKSILDLFRDIVYFPYVTKIIGAYIHIAAAKPHPQQIQQIFKQLPDEVVQFSNKKGLLSLSPAIVEDLVLPLQKKQFLPLNYGTVDKNWDNIQKYNSKAEKVHEQTLQKRIIHFLDGKVGWITVILFLSCTIGGHSLMKRGQFKKMIIQNGTFACMLLTAIALLIKIKRVTKHPKKQLLIQQIVVQKQQ